MYGLDSDSIRIEGGKPLQGSVYIQGSKNAALPLMAAALLHEGVTILHNCPPISDVRCMEAILRHLGVVTYWEGNTLYLDAGNITSSRIEAELGSRMRSSIILLGALLGRKQEVTIPYPGGCVIGRRPIDFHIHALSELGIKVWEEEGMLRARGTPKGGGRIFFPRSSVGASQNAVLAAVLAPGVTILEGCAIEPEVVWLCRILTEMGADIRGIGTSRLEIQGVTSLRDVEFTVPADRIVAGTYLCACAATRGSIVIENPPLQEMQAILRVYKKIGGQYKVNGGTLSLCSQEEVRPLDYVETEIYPGFPTDMQSPLLAVLAGIPGRSHVRETVFEDRFKVVQELQKMGACIHVDQRDAYIEGREELTGCEVNAFELRGGAALVIAGLSAKGETLICNRHFIERGYANICEDIEKLGGRLEKR